MTHVFRCVAVALALPLGALGAQDTPVLQSGARVRVVNDDHVTSLRVVGRLESIDSSTIIVRRENGESVNVPRQPGTRLDVSAGPGMCSPGRRGNCVAIGFLGGAGLGALAGAISVQGCRDTGNAPCALAYLVTVPLGALVGTRVGMTVGGEHWHRAELPARLSIGPDGSGRFAVGTQVLWSPAPLPTSRDSRGGPSAPNAPTASARQRWPLSLMHFRESRAG